jgi:hypothetical protein
MDEGDLNVATLSNDRRLAPEARSEMEPSVGGAVHSSIERNDRRGALGVECG